MTAAECALPGYEAGRWCVRPLGHGPEHADQDGRTWIQAVPKPHCGARYKHYTCTRAPGHRGGHIDQPRNEYWQADEARAGAA